MLESVVMIIKVQNYETRLLNSRSVVQRFSNYVIADESFLTFQFGNSK